MKALIIEDEAYAADKIESLLKEIDPSIQVMARLGSIRESVMWLRDHSCDILFLDIQLSDGISFSIFEQVSVNIPVIFTTAFDQYAIRAFKLNSIAYLLKPISRGDLEESLKKYRTFKTAFGIDFDLLLSQLQGREPEFRKRFMIQIGEKIRKVEVSEIAYFHILEKGVYLTTFTGHSYPVEFTLDKLENLLNPDHFFRINRKYVVNMNAITNMIAYSRGRIKLELTPKTEDPSDAIVSIDRSAGFRKWLNR